MASSRDQPQHEMVAPGPSWRDWSLLVVSLVFVGSGLFVLPGNFDVGIVTIVFFGFCAIAALTTIVRKRRDRRTRPLRAAIVGGLPIRPSRLRAAALGAGLLVLGAVLIVFGGKAPLLIRVLSWFVLLVGALFTAGVAWGKLPVGHLLFTPRGLTLGRHRYAITVDWDDMVALDAAEFHDNPLLRIGLREGAKPLVEPPAFTAKAYRELANSQALMGAPVTVMTGQYGIDLPLLIKAMERYVWEPESRAELDSSRLLSRA